ncbi:MAG: tetratricopeptide repeat protein [Bacteroidota bacterium]|nr:tetratricopeptide repeat protein [Bacteroidota bacterium]
MKKKSLHITLLLAAISISGCIVYDPVADFAKQRYTNTISYFNTFYNAQRLFDDGESEVEKAKRDFLERGSSARLFSIPSSARTKFQASIEKNSKVLSFYSDSKWVDDALLMIGKAYFYMEDDVRAERKFLELAVQFPGSELIPESQLWLGKSLLRQKKIDDAIKQFEEILSKGSEIEDKITGEAAYELAQYYFSIDDFPNAIKFYMAAVDLISNDEFQTQIYFQIGKSHAALGQYELAEKAYANAEKKSPLYSLIFQSQLEQTKMHAFQKNFSKALEELNAMLNDTKNTEFFSKIHFEIATVLGYQGKTIESIEQYRYVDTAFARTEEAARSYFAIAQYYETVEVNYDSARVAYNKAKTEFPSSGINKEATLKADIFNKYSALFNDLSKFDSLYTNAVFIKAEYDSGSVASPDTLFLKKDTISIVKDDPKIKKMIKPGAQEIKKDTVQLIDSTKIKESLKRGVLQVKLIDSLQRSIIRTKFDLAGLFYLEIQNADSALFWFDNIVKNSPKSEFAPRALYTIAEIYRTEKQKKKSILDSIYNVIVIQYPNSPYANEARKNIGMQIVETGKDTVLELFEKAEVLADTKKYDQAIMSYKNIADHYPTSLFSAKALFTAGWHYENSLMNNDSAIAVYRRLLVKFPLSQFANNVRSKVTEYDNEMKRIEDEKQRKIEEQKLKEQQEKLPKVEPEKKSEQSPVDTLSSPKNIP